MKKSYYFAIAAAALVASACAQKAELPEPEGVQVTIHASQEGNADTRTTLQDGGTQVYWEPADGVKVFFKGSGSRFVSQNTSNATAADFTGTLSIFAGMNEGDNSSNLIWGLYPYRADATSDGNSVTTTLPSQQTGRAGSFAKNTHITLARSGGLDLAFYNVTGGIRFSLTQEGIKSVSLEGNNGESIAGTIKIAFENGVPAVKKVTSGESVITLTAPDGGTFLTGRWYYIETIPCTLSGGIKMMFYKDGESAKLSSRSSISIKRGRYGNLADADEGLIFKSGGDEPSPSDIIQFEDPIAKYACVEKFDTNGDGEVSYEEAAAATSLSGLFTNWNTVTKFDEIKYFTGVTSTSGVFTGLKNLESITIPENITTLGSFQNCASLQSVVLPSGLASLPSYCFDGCSSLTNVTLPSVITVIPNYCFRNCNKLTSIDIPSTVTAINGYAFYGCSSLSDISLPSGVKTIGQYAFNGCSALNAVALPSDLTKVSDYCFQNCSSLRSITWPSVSELSIGSYAFDGCSTLTSVSIPEGCTVGTYAFSGCSALESVALPADMTAVPSYCFMGCSSLRSITWPSVSALSIGSYAFSGCAFKEADYTLRLPESVKQIGRNALNVVKHLIVPSLSAVTIESDAFGNNYSKLIYVPAGMVEMYKVRTNWSNYADFIHAIAEYPCRLAGGTVGEAVDLGLPSGLRWASWNVGASSPEEYGDYFAWGETEPKSVYNWSTYKWCNGDYNRLTKYCTQSSYWDGAEPMDKKTVLDPEDDAAHVNWGGTWRMATYNEWNELNNNCTWTWTTLNGVYGRKVTSNKSGYTDKWIFLPAAGYRNGSSLDYAGSRGYYWSSSLTTGYPYYACYVYFNSGGVYWGDYNRDYGRSVRPVSE